MSIDKKCKFSILRVMKLNRNNFFGTNKYIILDVMPRYIENYIALLLYVELVKSKEICLLITVHNHNKL